MRIKEHEEKISAEVTKTAPDNKLTKYWQREIAAYKDAITKAEKRLRRRR